MSLLDDILGPIKEIASVKNEMTQSLGDVRNTLADAKNQVAGEVSGVRESLNDAASPVVEPSDVSVDDGDGGEKN